MNLHETADHLAQLIEDKLGVRGAGLEAKLARSGRALPKHIRADLTLLINALAYDGHPKLSRLTDTARMERGIANAERYLTGLDGGARRRGLVLDWIARQAFNFLVLGVLLLAILRWRGFV